MSRLKEPSWVGRYKGIPVYKTTREYIRDGDWKFDTFYIIEDEGYKLFRNRKIYGYTDAKMYEVQMLSEPYDYCPKKEEKVGVTKEDIALAVSEYVPAKREIPSIKKATSVCSESRRDGELTIVDTELKIGREISIDDMIKGLPGEEELKEFGR